MLASPKGLPCNRPPWGSLVAIDLATGEQRWQVPLGRIPEFKWLPWAGRWGSPNMGGSMVTAGGLVFIGAAMDNYLRAYDLETRERAVEGEAACWRSGDTDDLRRQWQAVRRHRRRRDTATWEPPLGTTSWRSG